MVQAVVAVGVGVGVAAIVHVGGGFPPRPPGPPRRGDRHIVDTRSAGRRVGTLCSMIVIVCACGRLVARFVFAVEKEQSMAGRERKGAAFFASMAMASLRRS